VKCGNPWVHSGNSEISVDTFQREYMSSRLDTETTEHTLYKDAPARAEIEIEYVEPPSDMSKEKNDLPVVGKPIIK
jgi:hypothetical protein